MSPKFREVGGPRVAGAGGEDPSRTPRRPRSESAPSRSPFATVGRSCQAAMKSAQANGLAASATYQSLLLPQFGRMFFGLVGSLGGADGNEHAKWTHLSTQFGPRRSLQTVDFLARVPAKISNSLGVVHTRGSVVNRRLTGRVWPKHAVGGFGPTAHRSSGLWTANPGRSTCV